MTTSFRATSRSAMLIRSKRFLLTILTAAWSTLHVTSSYARIKGARRRRIGCLGLYGVLSCLALAQAPPNPYARITGTLQGPNGLPASNLTLSFTPTQQFFVQGLGSSSCAGYVLEVNAGLLTCADTVNFNDAQPIAPPFGININWQTVNNPTTNTDSVSAYLLGDSNPVHCLTGQGIFANCVTRITPGTGLTTSPNPLIGDGTISIATTGVTAADYICPSLSITLTGQITHAVNGTCSGGGGGSPGAPFGSAQGNNAGSFGGIPNTSINFTTGLTAYGNVNNDWIWTPAMNWSQTITSSLTAAVPNTLTLTPCPVGVDATSGRGYEVYLSGSGNSESVFVTGGNCLSGASTGTIQFTPIFSYTSGNATVGSSSLGIQETINQCSPIDTMNDAFVSNQCRVKIPPNGPGIPVTPVQGVYNYNIYGTIYLHTTQTVLDGEGATLNCLERGPCLHINGTIGYGWGSVISHYAEGNVVKGLSFRSTIPNASDPAYIGSAITSTSVALSVATITTASAHGYRVGDWVVIMFTDDTRYWGDALVTAVPTATSFQYAARFTTIASQNTPGVVALDYVAVRDDGQSSLLDYLSYDTEWDGGFTVYHFNHFFDLWDDENLTINHFNDRIPLGSSPNWSGSAIYSGGANDYPGNRQLAPVLSLQNSNISPTRSNGVTLYNSNGCYIDNTVIQATALWQVYSSNSTGNFQGCHLRNVYPESTAGQNPVSPATSPYPGLGIAGLIAGNSSGVASFSIKGNGGVAGIFPSGGSGATPYTYYVVAKCVGTGTSVSCPVGSSSTSPMQILNWLSTGSDSIPVNWPRVANGTDTITYDVIRMTTPSTGNPYPSTGNCPGGLGGICGSVVTGLSQTTACSGGLVCTYTDTATSTTSAYTVAQANYAGVLGYWPGSLVSVGSTVTVDKEFGNLVGVGLNGNPIQSVSGSCFGNASAGGYDTCLSSITSGSNAIPNQTATILSDGAETTSAMTFSKGRLNFTTTSTAFISPHHIITLIDSNPSLTKSTNGYRPLASDSDTYIGTDMPTTNNFALGQLSLGAGLYIDEYINNKGDGINFLTRLSSQQFRVTTSSMLVDNTLLAPAGCFGCGPFVLSGTQVTDNFLRANGPLGANYTVTAGAFAVSSNAALVTGITGSVAMAPYTGTTFANNQYAQAQWLGGGSWGGAICVRCSNSAATGYIFSAIAGTSSIIYKIVAGTPTVLASGGTPFIQGDNIRLEVNGTTITAKDNGSVVLVATDSSIASGYPGLAAVNFTGGILDNFRGGDLNWVGNVATVTITSALNLSYLSNGCLNVTGGVVGSTGSPCGSGSGGGTVTAVTAGAGLTSTPNPIISTGTISIPSAGVTNTMLANNSITITAGSGLSGGGTVALGGTVTLTNASSGGTVTSVTFTGDGVLLSATPTSPVTTTGTLTATLINQSANRVLAGPTTGSAAAPSFRALVSADIPNNAANTTGTAANLLSCTPTAAGDICYYTGAAWAKLAGNASGTQYLQETSSGVPSWTTPSGGSVSGPGTTVSGNIVLWNNTIGTLVSDAGFAFPLAAAHIGTLAAGSNGLGGFATLTTAATSGFARDAAGTVTVGVLVSGDIPNNTASTSGNAGTATALASVPSGCSAGQFANSIAASGNLGCGTPGGVANNATQYSMTYYSASGTTNTLSGLTAPTSNGVYYVGYAVVAGVSVAPTDIQLGFVNRAVSGATTTDTILYSDIGSVEHDKAASGTLAWTLPTPSSLGNTQFVTSVCNYSAQTDMLTPSGGWTINGNASLSVTPKSCHRISVDPFTSTNWLSVGQGPGVVPTNAVLAVSPGAGIAHFAGSTQTVTSSTIATADIAASAVTLAKQADNTANTLQGFDASGHPVDVTIGANLTLSGNSLVATGGGGSNAFSALSSSTNTTAAMVIGSGASLTVSGTGTNNATSLNGNTYPASAAFNSTGLLFASSTSVATTNAFLTFTDTTGSTNLATLTLGGGANPTKGNLCLVTNTSGGGWCIAGSNPSGSSFLTMTIPNTGISFTAAGVNVGQVFTKQNVFNFNGTASNPTVWTQGTPFTGGSSATNYPQTYLDVAGNTQPAFSLGGTMLGINAPTSFTGNLLALYVNGSTAKATIDNLGNLVLAGTATIATAPTISSFSSAGLVHNSAAGVLSSSLLVNADITAGTIDLTTKVTGVLPLTNSSPLFLVNAQSATYTVVAGDFADYKTIPVASGTFTITLVASGTQPANGQSINIINYGSGVVTVARNGQNINGAAANISIPAGSSSAPAGVHVVSDGTNYFAQTLGSGTAGGVSSITGDGTLFNNSGSAGAVTLTLASAAAFSVLGNATGSSTTPTYTTTASVLGLTLNGATSGSLALTMTATGGTMVFGSLGSLTNPVFQPTGAASNTGIYFPSTSSIATVQAGVASNNISGGGIETSSGNFFAFGSTSSAIGTRDTTICRLGAGSVEINSGASCGATGSLTAATLSGTTSIAAGGFTAVSIGTPTEVYNTSQSSQTSSISVTTMLANPASDRNYRFSVYIGQVAAGATCTVNGSVAVSVVYTDSITGVSYTYIVPFTVSNGTALAQTVPLSTSTPTVSNLGSGVIQMRVKASTNIQYSTTYSAGTCSSGSPSYSVFPVLTAQ